MIKGMDISEWNGRIDWKKVGLDFAIPRTGYGTEVEDRRIGEYVEGAKAAGIVMDDVYHFSYAVTKEDAQDEADFCISIIKKYGIPCKTVYIDWEYDSDKEFRKQTGKSATVQELDDIITAFCERVKAAGFRAGVYFNKDFMDNRISPEVLDRYAKWYARYTNHPEIMPDIWQASDVGHVDGMATVVDLDYKQEEAEPLNYDRIKAETIGRSFDIDGAYGPQCWDFTAYVMEHYYGGFPIHCGATGYACDIANQKAVNGILNFMVDVGLNTQLKPGDICVWETGSPDCPYSHIALYDHDNGQSEVYFLGQNQLGHPYVDVQRISTAGIIGVFRAKNMGAKIQKPHPSSKGNARSDWDYNAVLRVGDTVKSKSCAIRPWRSTGSAIHDSCVNVPELGGLVPLSDVSEAADTKDGRKDDYLANTNARVFLTPCRVEAVDSRSNLVRVHGYWINPGPLAKKV